jgi:hypothetical protein
LKQGVVTASKPQGVPCRCGRVELPGTKCYAFCVLRPSHAKYMLLS